MRHLGVFIMLLTFNVAFVSCSKDERRGDNGNSNNNNNNNNGSDYYESSLPGLGSGKGVVDCESSDWIEVIDGDWVISFIEMPSSGTVQWDPENGPELIVWDESTDYWYTAISGSGTWSGKVFKYNGVIVDIDSEGDPDAETYTIEGQFTCP